MKNLDQYANQKMQFKDNTKLAIIAGSGDLVLSCIKTCNKQNINIYLIGIDGFYENKNYKPNLSISLGKIGNIFSILKNKDIKNNYILEAHHPSPLSANKGGWFGNQHFTKTNDILEKYNKEKLTWIPQ